VNFSKRLSQTGTYDEPIPQNESHPVHVLAQAADDAGMKGNKKSEGNRLEQEVAMSITAIPSLFSAAPAGENETVNVNPPAAQSPQPAATPTDTVQLTEADRVYQLYNQGQQVPQIANTLSLSEAAVNSYLNISNNAA
jgi:DNA-binding NarL/FixJ family response regulator